MISEMLDYFGIKRAIVVAHSFSGAVATALALNDPSRVAGLVLIAPVLHPWSTGVAWYYTLTSMPVIGPLFAHTLALPAGTALLESTIAAVFAPQVAPADYAQRAAIRLVLRPKNFIANASDVVGLLEFVTAQAPRYSELKMPTTVITGDRDTIVSPRIHSLALVDAVPHSKLIMLEGVGHMPHHVAQDRVIAAIEEVVEQARGSQGDKVTR
jgi:pimeloyl-ACP methyl ester carboxylesterase